MKQFITFTIAIIFIATKSYSQVEPAAGNWKTWFVSSGKDYRLPAPNSYKEEITQVIEKQKSIDDETRRQINYWSAGAPGYRWQSLMMSLWPMDTSSNGVLAFMLLGVASYDATIAAWDTKYTYNRSRPFAADKSIKSLIPKPESPSYPCEYSVVAGVATTIISHFYPALADSVHKMATELMNARVSAGVAFPSDVNAGFDLGKKIAVQEIESTKNYVDRTPWDGKIPEGGNRWRGKFALFPHGGNNKTIVLTSANQFRPGPPPDFAKDMAELKNFKQTPRSMYNALFYANNSFWDDVLNKKLFEYNLHVDPPRAARLYAITAIGYYDGFASCFDAKYAYWGIRPNQYDTSYHSLIMTPPFPGYPSGHAMLSSVMAELFSYFFPAEQDYFRQKAKDVAESRFQAGIHFRTDNEVALDLGKKVANAIIEKVKNDGSNNNQ